MKKIVGFFLGTALIGIYIAFTGCLKSGMENLVNSSDKDLSTVDYTYRFLYNDTIQKGTDKQEIEQGRVCEVLFKKNTERIQEAGVEGFKTTISYDINSILKAGPTGSVTTEMLYSRFQELIATDQLKKLWVYMTISDAATITPEDGAPMLGKPGDFSNNQTYAVKAADGSVKKYLIVTIKGF